MDQKRVGVEVGITFGTLDTLSVASLRTDHFYSSYDLRKRILTVRTVSSLLLGYTFNAV